MFLRSNSTCLIDLKGNLNYLNSGFFQNQFALIVGTSSEEAPEHLLLPEIRYVEAPGSTCKTQKDEL